MDDTIAEDYKSSLCDLNFNSKPLINMLTMLAEENKKHAPLIVKTIVDHINSVSPEAKLHGLYLVDSIIKNLGAEYLKIFSQHLTSLFTSVFEKVDESTRSLMFKLRQTWTNIVPNKTLYSLDVGVKKVDPAWPVTAKNPTKRILINPKFLDGPSEEKKLDDVAPTSLQKEEDKLKQKQGEVLKQLLAKQEQLKQLEEKKRQMIMQNKIVPPSTPSNPIKQSIFRDPRMVKINNVSQPASKPDSNSVTEQKVVQKCEATSVTSNVSSIKKPNVLSKAPVQSNLDCKSSIDKNALESSFTTHMNQTNVLEKVASKNKNNKCFPKKSKSPTIAKEKIDQKVKSNFEKSTDSIKTGDKTTKTEFSSNKSSEKSPKEHSKAPKNSPSPKKKNVCPDSNKTHHQTAPNHPPYPLRKKVTLPRIPKKSDKLKCSTNADSSNTSYEIDSRTGNRPNTRFSGNNYVKSENKFTENKPNTTFSGNNYVKSENKFTENKSNATFSGNNYVKNEDKFVKRKGSNFKKKPTVKAKEFSKSEQVEDRIHSDVSDGKSATQKDQDLRMSTLPLAGEVTHPKVPKLDIPVSHSSANVDKSHPPRKKLKTEDIENCSPDYRDESPVLFGNEDQDLRQSNHPDEDITSKDWRQYKATHPDEFSPSPRQDNFQGRFRFRRHHFTEFKYRHYPPDFDRNDSFRYFRGKNFPKRGVHRSSFAPHFPRGNRGHWLYNSHIDSVMFNSHAFLQQAEEKFRSGRISETEYMDLRRDLQKMVESSEYKVPKMQHMDHHHRIPEFQNFQEYETQKQQPLNDLKIQRPSATPPPVKSFVLDGIDRVIHYIDDKAIVLMDNNEPRELTFKNEQRNIFVEGLAKPLTVAFDGKSVEFEIDGRRHNVRFGTPGRELYIDNHPYEAKFGGPPVAVMLEDSCVYKLHVSGPNPQVVIGDKPVYELFAKFNNKMQGISVKEKMDVDPEGETVKSESETVAPPDSVPPQDVDMRMKLERVEPATISINKDSPFYSEDMKDVDWRYIPSSSNLESDKNPPRVHEKKSDDFEKWTKNEENSDKEPFHEHQNNQAQTYILKEPPPTFEWKKPVLEHYAPANVDNRILPDQYPSARVDNRVPPEQYPQATADNRVPPEQYPQATVDNRVPPDQYPQATVDNRVPPEQYPQATVDNRVPPEQYPQATVHNRVTPEKYTPATVHSRVPPEQYQPAPVDNRVAPEQYQPAPVDNRNAPEQYQPAPVDNRNAPEQYQPAPVDNRVAPEQYQPAPVDNRVAPTSSSHDSWYQEEQSHWPKNDYRENNQGLNHESSVYQPPNNNRQQFQGNQHYRHNVSHSYRPHFQRRHFQAEYGRGRNRGPRYGSRAPNIHRGGIRPNYPASMNPPPRFPALQRRPGLLPPPPLPPSFPRFTFASVAPEDDENTTKAPVKDHNEHILGTASSSALSATEAMSTESESNEVKVDVSSLLQKLMAAGIINIKQEPPEPMSVETSTSETDDTKEDESIPEEIPRIYFTPASLKIQHAGVISALHSGLQCATCGMRFKDKQSDQYSHHLDWHFRMNRKEKDGAKKAVSRRWYYEIEDWIQFEEFEDFEERVPSYFELEADTNQPDEVEVPVIVSVPATSDDEETCPVCKDRFQLFWVEEEEEWHYRDAVRHDNITYHPACYEDFKKASEADKSLKEDNLSFDLSELEEEITEMLNAVLDTVCKISEIKAEPLDEGDTPVIKSEPLDECERTEIKSEPPESPEAAEEVEAPVEEEVILEGKPGEEEIIGLILESDMETDTETTSEPKEESKMVVMQSGGITLKVKAESLQCHSPSNPTEKEAKSENKTVEDEEIDFRPPTPDPNFEVMPPVKKGRELSGLCTIM